MHTVLALFSLISFTCLLVCYRIFSARNRLRCTIPTNWPVLGMLPALLLNFARIHDYITELLIQTGGTFLFRGPVFGNVEMLLTSDPANVNYILANNFPNFGKGPEFKKIFDVLGDGIFTAQSESWEYQRRIAVSAMASARFHEFVANTTWQKTETGLIPILQHVSYKGTDVDLQDLFQRFTLDCSSIFTLGHDPASLSKDLPHVPYEKAFGVAEEAVFQRHLLPEPLWKLQKWLQIGKEKQLSQAMETIDQYLHHHSSLKREKLQHHLEDRSCDILTSCIKANVPEHVLKDLMLNLIFGGNHAVASPLTFLFWLLAINPIEEEKIRQEIAASCCCSDQHGKKWNFSNKEMLNKLIYLHGALCETLRLFPAIAINHKAPLKEDILPSGHRLKPNTKVILPFYSMGRMESIWGKDCIEFKPGRWISETTGHVKVEPPYKFTAFNAGPRTCIGKNVAFLQVKIAAAAIISRFKIELAEGHTVRTTGGVVLLMKHGLHVKVINSG